MKTPNITPVQKYAVAGWIVAQGIAYGILPAGQEQLELSITATAVAIAWKWADAHIRHGRALSRDLHATTTVVATDHPRGLTTTTVTPAQ